MPHHPPSPAPRPAFSLVELMIVITIIGLLISILVPAVVAVQDMANSVACQSNLEQIAKAVLTYATENREAIVPTRYGDASAADGLNWCNLLIMGDYISAPNTADLDGEQPANNKLPTEDACVFLCPVSTQQAVTDPTAIDTPDEDAAQGWVRLGNDDWKVDCSYYWNGCTDNFSENPADPDDDWILDFPSLAVDADSGRIRYHTLSEIRRRHSMAMVMDGILYNGHAYPALIAARHPAEYGRRSRTNVAYYDGHVEGIIRGLGGDGDPDNFTWEENEFAKTDDEEGRAPFIKGRENLSGGPPFFRIHQQRPVTATEEEEDGG